MAAEPEITGLRGVPATREEPGAGRVGTPARKRCPPLASEGIASLAK